MIPLQNPVPGAVSTIFSSRKFSRRSLAARQRSTALRAVTARQRFGAASRVAALALAGSLAYGDSARAASGSWLATPTSAVWNIDANWSAAPYPNGTGDTATFAVPLSGTIGSAANPITFTAAINLQNLVFTGATVGAFNIGAVGGTNGITLRGTGASATPSFNNSISIAASGANPEVVNTPLSFSAPSSTTIGYNFLNNSTTTSATLSVTGAITTATASNRFTSLQLDGTNTGNNTISGVITSGMGSSAAGQGNIVLNKVGTGRWILSGANLFSGAGITNVAQGINVNAGTLVAGNNQAFGTSGTANADQVNINSGGTVEIGAGFTLDNGVSLNLNNGGTVQSNGTSTTNGRINVGTTVTGVTVATINASDVFTIGNGTNDFTGGTAGTTVSTISGPGTVLLNSASNYAGAFSLNSGTTRLGSPTALGAAATATVGFGASTTGRLQLYGNSATVVGLSTNATVGTPVVENGAAGTATLTVNNAVASSYAGVLQNGTVGTLALTKSGAGALTLSGVNTYSGATTVSGGSLFVNNASGSGTGTSAVSVTSGGILGGNGTISGAVTVAGRLSPGATGTGSIGNLTVGSLTLSAGTNLDYDLTNTSTLDQITVTNAGGLTINGGQFNLNGATGTFTANGVYNLIGYNGAVGGTGVSALTLNSVNQDSANKTYTFGLSGSFVTLTITNSANPADYYVPNADSAYSNGANWSTGTPPNAVGAFAAFGGNGSAALTANRTVTVDGAYTVGTVAFNSANGFGYTLADGGAGTGLTLNNGATGAFVSDTAGSHTVASGLTLTPNGATFSVTAAADTLTVSGIVGSDASTDIGLTKTGNGTLVLSGANTYFGGTTLNGGTIQINSAASLGDASGALTFGGGTLQLLADVTTPRNYQVTGSSNAVIDTNGHNLNLGGTLTPVGGAAGGVVKNGLGTLTLGGTNTYTGTTAINAGVVSVAADAGLGAAPATAATNLTIGAGTLQATAGFTLNANRNITLNNAASTIDVTNGATLAVSSVITGSGALTKTSAGQLTITTPTFGQNTYSGGTFANAGTILLGDASAVGTGLGTGAITFTGGTVSTRFQGNTTPGSQTSDLVNNLVVGAGQTGTLILNGRQNLAGSLTGSGTFNLQVDYVRDSYTGNWSAFTGQLNVLSNTNGGDFRMNTTTGFGTAKVNLGAGVHLYEILNFNPSATINIGELTGDATSNIAGGTVAGRILTYSVGGANTDATYAGVIQDSTGATAVTKVGTGTWTLTGANTYTNITTVNGGTLNVNGSLASGSAVTVNTGGTLSGTNGTVAGTVTVNSGGTLLAGTGGAAPTVGNLSTGALTLSSGSVFSAVLGGDNSVSQLLSSNVTAAGSFSITLTATASFAATGEALTLIPSGFSGAFTNTTYMTGGYLFTVDPNAPTGMFQVDVTPVPETSTWVGGALLMATLGWNINRRRTRAVRS